MPGMSARMKMKKRRFPIVEGTELAPDNSASPIIIGVGLSDAITSGGYRSVKTTDDSYGTISDDQYGGYTIFYFHTKSNVSNVVRLQLVDANGLVVMPFNKIEVTVDSQPAETFFQTHVTTDGGAPYSAYYRSQNATLQTYINGMLGGSPLNTISVVFKPKA